MFGLASYVMFFVSFTRVSNGLPHIKVVQQNWQVAPNLSRSIPLYTLTEETEINLHCEAPVPIKWNAAGVMADPSGLIMHTPSRDLLTATFNIFLTVNTLWWTLLLISCEMIDNSENRDLILIRHLAQNEDLAIPQEDYRPQRNVVPIFKYFHDYARADSPIVHTKQPNCITTDIKFPVTLFKLDRKRMETPEMGSVLRYNIVYGFWSDPFPNGTHKCQLPGEQEVVVNASLKSDLDIFPKKDNVVVSVNETIHFRCLSKTGSAQLTVVEPQEQNGVSVNYSYVESGMIAQLSVQIGNGTNYEKAEGRMLCNVDNATVKSWQYQFLKPPELQIERLYVKCYNTDYIMHLNCTNILDCDLLLRMKINLVSSLKRTSYGAYENSVWGKHEPYKELYTLYLYGVMQCGHYELPSMTHSQWMYFTALDNFKYTDWRQVPRQQLLRLNATSPVFYATERNQFSCMAVAFLFTDKLFFQLEFKNGSNQILKHNNDTTLETTSRGHSQKGWAFYPYAIIGNIETILPLDTIGINCLAAWGNSSKVEVTSVNFEVRQLMTPKFESRLTNAAVLRTFYVGDKKRRLSCFASGDPQPEYEWYFNHSKALDVLPGTKTHFDEDGKGYLEFPKLVSIIATKYIGEYHCVAFSRLGNATQIIHLNIISNENSTEVTVLGAGLGNSSKYKQDDNSKKSATANLTTLSASTLAITTLIAVHLFNLKLKLMIFICTV